jgi:hypothetical protein
MAGFVAEAVAQGQSFGASLKLVDLSEGDVLQSRVYGRTRLAWARWRDSRQLSVIERRDRLLLIEGQPDRLPAAEEPLPDWLVHRGGSFRGLQIEFGGGRPVRICAFVDPLNTRPIYLLSTRTRICVADKLSTIVANTPGLECDWGGLLEGAVLGSIYSAETSARDVEQLLPGEIVQIDGASISRRHRSPYPLGTASRPDPDAAERLKQGLRQAVAETWVNPESRLLLSGGLDSRLILGLAEGERKVLTVDWYPEETAIARRVAAACGADFELIPFVAEDYCERMQYGFLVTAAMHQSRYITNLGMTRRWRAAGIPAIAHAYFHNTIFRGWISERWRRYPDRDSPLYPYMGHNAEYFDRFGQYRSTTPQVLQLLSAEGRRQLKHQLARLSDGIEPRIIDGFDVTFERRVLQNVARQVYFSIFLGWIEEIDVESPVFHPAVWDWYSSTHPADRHNDNAVSLLYQTIGRGLAEIPDSGTGQPVRPTSERRRVRWRNQFWYPAARGIYRAALRLGLWRPRPEYAIPGQDWNKVFRQRPIVDALCAGVEGMRENPLFDWRLLSSTLAAYLSGDEELLDALWAVAIIGQWNRFVQTAGSGYRAVKIIGDDASASRDGAISHSVSMTRSGP